MDDWTDSFTLLSNDSQRLFIRLHTRKGYLNFEIELVSYLFQIPVVFHGALKHISHHKC